MKNTKILMIATFLVFALKLVGQPTNNPVKEKYLDATHWTEKLKWDNVTDASTVSGLLTSTTTTDLRFPDATGTVYAVDSLKLQNAMKAISNAGGGVLYFPAGKYILDFNLYLPTKVILRGATPPSDKQDAKKNNFSPPTIWIFPKYLYVESGTGTPDNTAFKIIKSDSASKQAGLVYLTINRAIILFEPNYSKTIDATHEAPYKGTYEKEQPTSLITDVIVFGIRQANAIQPDSKIPYPKQEQYSRFPFRMTSNISVFAWNNCLIANNRLNDTEGCSPFGDGDPFNGEDLVIQQAFPTLPIDIGSYTNTTYPILKDDFLMKNYKYEDGTLTSNGGDVMFDYTNHYGISVNRLKTSQVNGYAGSVMATLWHHTPENEPGSFGTNAEVLDNWVYKTMRPALQVGGLGIKVNRNICRDFINKQDYNLQVDPAGRKKPVGAQTFESRGIDISGWGCEVDGNYIEAYRSKIGGYLSTDGEGIMHQESSGSSCNGMSITNSTTRNYIGLYKSRDMNNVNIVGNNFIGDDAWMLMLVADYADPAKGASINNMLVENNKGKVGLDVRGSKGGKNVIVRNNDLNGYKMSCYVDTLANISKTNSFRFYSVVPDGSSSGVEVFSRCTESEIPNATFISPAKDLAYKNFSGTINVVVKAPAPATTIQLYVNHSLVASGTLDVNQEFSYNLVVPNKDSAYIILAKINTADPLAPEVFTDKRVIVVNSYLTGTNSNAKNIEKFTVYPNPVKNTMQIKLPNDLSANATVKIIDITGTVVYQNNTNTNFVNVEHLKQGLYIVLLSDEAKVYRSTFVKE